ncbi:hypothetical protein [Nocardia paucivorans]|uniref:hypothetical protein n=1 Tax=Nocardia paucivorans TaxID=114259 RepID=UPI0002F2A911|nr:hypothetical protein [Nocardia paucivorans]
MSDPNSDRDSLDEGLDRIAQVLTDLSRALVTLSVDLADFTRRRAKRAPIWMLLRTGKHLRKPDSPTRKE